VRLSFTVVLEITVPLIDDVSAAVCVLMVLVLDPADANALGEEEELVLRVALGFDVMLV